MRKNISQKSPVSFYVEDLEPGATYRIILYSANAKGRSEPIVLDEISFKGVAKYTSSKYIRALIPGAKN